MPSTRVRKLRSSWFLLMRLLESISPASHGCAGNIQSVTGIIIAGDVVATPSDLLRQLHSLWPCNAVIRAGGPATAVLFRIEYQFDLIVELGWGRLDFLRDLLREQAQQF